LHFKLLDKIFIVILSDKIFIVNIYSLVFENKDLVKYEKNLRLMP